MLVMLSPIAPLLPCYPMLSNVIQCYPVLSNAIQCYPILANVNQCFPMLSPQSNYPQLLRLHPCYPMLFDVIQCYPMLSNVTQCYPTLSTHSNYPQLPPLLPCLTPGVRVQHEGQLASQWGILPLIGPCNTTHNNNRPRNVWREIFARDWHVQVIHFGVIDTSPPPPPPSTQTTPVWSPLGAKICLWPDLTFVNLCHFKNLLQPPNWRKARCLGTVGCWEYLGSRSDRGQNRGSRGTDQKGIC